ncbi:MAG: hypothetical protein II927_05125, partial [Paludibacteraceae bacterium]|nr:hypothetical protein [Paludibacteraceae bacterium]
MGIFSRLFGRKKEEVQTVVSEPQNEEAHEVDSADTADENTSTELKTKVHFVNTDTGFPIDEIFVLVRANYEKRGYNDAMRNPDGNYMKAGSAKIISELMARINQVTLIYEKFLSDVNVQIQILEEQGLLDMKRTLMSKQLLYEKHLVRLKEMKEMAEKRDSEMMGMVQSYERGFQSGII